MLPWLACLWSEKKGVHFSSVWNRAVELERSNQAPRPAIRRLAGLRRSGSTICLGEKSIVWFLARNPALGRRYTADALNSRSLSAVDNAWISDTLLAQAAATKNAVFLERSRGLAWSSGSKGGSANNRSAWGRSHVETIDFGGGCLWNMPLVRSWATLELETVVPPGKPWWTAPTAVLQALT